jgi:CHAT domain-containing protein
MPEENAIKEITRLTANLNELRRGGGAGFCFYVGTSASMTTEGYSAAEELRRSVLRAPFGENMTEAQLAEASASYLEEKFSNAWKRLAFKMRDLVARETTLKLSSDEGHSALASILKSNCFSLIITPNNDTLIEDALLQEGIPRSQWSVMVNGLHSPDVIRDELLNPSGKFVIVKLCGDLYSKSYSVTDRDMAQSIPPLVSAIEPYLSRPMVVTGYGAIDDNIFKAFPKPRDIVYYIGTGAPPGDWNFYKHFLQEQRVDILDKALTFKEFCNVLARRLDTFQKVEAYGMSVTRSDVEDVRGDTDESDFLVELIDIKQRREQEKQTPVAAAREEPLLVLSELLNTFSIRFDNNQLLSFDVKGRLSYESERAVTWPIDVDELNVVMSDLARDIAAYHRLKDQEGRNTWRRHAKREGRHLYDSLMRSNEDLSKQLEVARQITRHPDVLSLNFIGPRNHLGMPYELLHDNNVPLALKYPLSRQISGLASQKPQKLDSMMRVFQRDRKPLKVLLIASDTGGLSVDDEVTELADLFKEKWQGKSEIKVLTTNDAGMSEVETVLRRCQYHIVHFAGHSQFDFEKPENSGLFVFRDKARRGGVGILSARQIALLLTDSETMFCYLSCCVGAMVGSRQRLRDDDYLGVIDAVIQAGVPYALGYRWYVTDSGSRRFVTSFYEKMLSDRCVPEQAALHARSQLYGRDGNDETWTSPIVVSQNILRTDYE